MSLDPKRFTLDEHTNQNWTLTVEETTTLEDVLKPAFLANVASKMRPYDRIRVRVDSGEWYAELLVVTCGRVWTKLVTIFKVDLSCKEVEQIEGEAYDQFYLKFRGPHLGWCVIRKADNESIKEKCQSKSEAQAWLASHVLTM